MPRLVIFRNTEPKEITIEGKKIKICRCGLTKDGDGLCDETHMIARDEDSNATYFYDDKLEREIVDMITDEDDLSDDCCSGHGHSHGSCACGNNSCGCGHDHGGKDTNHE